MRHEMKPEIERQLMRLLHGELPDGEAAEWRRRLEADAELATAFGRMREHWSDLDQPTPPPAGPELAAAFWSRVRRERTDSVAEMWRLAPIWSRALAAAALVAGIGIGALAGGTGSTSVDESLFGDLEPSLAESYWTIIADNGLEGTNGGER